MNCLKSDQVERQRNLTLWWLLFFFYCRSLSTLFQLDKVYLYRSNLTSQKQTGFGLFQPHIHHGCNRPVQAKNCHILSNYNLLIELIKSNKMSHRLERIKSCDLKCRMWNNSQQNNEHQLNWFRDISFSKQTFGMIRKICR